MTHDQALKIASKHTDRVYNIRHEQGWFRVLSSPTYTIGWVDPAGNYHSYTGDGWQMIKPDIDDWIELGG